MALGMTACTFGQPSEHTPNSDTNITKPNDDTDDKGNRVYSSMVNSVLNDNHVATLLTNAKLNEDLYKTGYFDPHPYAFLEKQGYNIYNIKEDKLKCKTVSYTTEDEPNSLYILTYVETKAEVDYYTEYQLRYTLSDKEMDDYLYLHKNDYIQALFLNNQISASKTAEVLSEAKISIEAHNGIRKTIRADKTVTASSVINDKDCDILYKGYNSENDRITLLIVGGPKYTNVLGGSDGRITECRVAPLRNINIKNEIYYEPQEDVIVKYSPNQLKTYLKSIRLINTEALYINKSQYITELKV